MPLLGMGGVLYGILSSFLFYRSADRSNIPQPSLLSTASRNINVRMWEVCSSVTGLLVLSLSSCSAVLTIPSLLYFMPYFPHHVTCNHLVGAGVLSGVLSPSSTTRVPLYYPSGALPRPRFDLYVLKHTTFSQKAEAHLHSCTLDT